MVDFVAVFCFCCGQCWIRRRSSASNQCSYLVICKFFSPTRPLISKAQDQTPLPRLIAFWIHVFAILFAIDCCRYESVVAQKRFIHSFCRRVCISPLILAITELTMAILEYEETTWGWRWVAASRMTRVVFHTYTKTRIGAQTDHSKIVSMNNFHIILSLLHAVEVSYIIFLLWHQGCIHTEALYVL